MKKKKVFLKILAVVLVLNLMITTLPSFSVFAEETRSEEKLTEKGELRQPQIDTSVLNFEGDLSLEELKTAELAPEETPEIVSKESISKNKHVNRLWEQEEDLNSIVFQNSDGTKTKYMYARSVKYKDKDGEVKDKSNKITETSNGDYTNAENDINVYFPKKLNKNKGVELKFDEYTVEMSPDINGNSRASRQTGHNKNFDPTEYVQYPDIFGDGISLRYTPTFEGYKEDIVLNEYTGINEFSFHLYTDGLSLAMNEEGIYCLIDPLSGETKAQMGELVIYDSKAFNTVNKMVDEKLDSSNGDFILNNESINDLEMRNKKYSHKYSIETVKQDNEYLITIFVDSEYLTDNERVYPVYIDPTINVSESDVDKTIQDAPIYYNKQNIASGENDYNVVGYQGSTYGVGRTLMKFPGLKSDTTYKNIPTNRITSLQLHIYDGSDNEDTARIDLWKYGGGLWNELTARCNNVAWNGNTTKITSKNVSGYGWSTFDLTSMVETWKGDLFALESGIMIKNYTSESSSKYSRHFHSTDHYTIETRPYLTYTYESISYDNLSLNQSKSGEMERGGEYWYKFTPTKSCSYAFYTLGSTDTYGELYYESSLLDSNDDDGDDNNFSITYYLEAGKTYKLKIRGYGSSTYGNYSIKTEYDYTAYAVYRDLGGTITQYINWHAALLVEPTKNFSLSIMEVVDETDVIQNNSWSGFIGSKDFHGVYRPKGTMTKEQRMMVAVTALQLESYDITYVLTKQMEATFTEGSEWIGYDDIDALRCDGFVEYCYESNGIRIYGNDDKWDISKASSENLSHHNIINITPKKQAQYYMTLVTSAY